MIAATVVTPSEVTKMAQRVLKVAIFLLVVVFEVDVTHSPGYGGPLGQDYRCSFLNQPAYCADTTKLFKVEKNELTYRIIIDENITIVNFECDCICELCSQVTPMGRGQ